MSQTLKCRGKLTTIFIIDQSIISHPTCREEVVHPVLRLAEPHVEPWGDNAALVDTARQLKNRCVTCEDLTNLSRNTAKRIYSLYRSKLIISIIASRSLKCQTFGTAERHQLLTVRQREATPIRELGCTTEISMISGRSLTSTTILPARWSSTISNSPIYPISHTGVPHRLHC